MQIGTRYRRYTGKLGGVLMFLKITNRLIYNWFCFPLVRFIFCPLTGCVVFFIFHSINLFSHSQLVLHTASLIHHNYSTSHFTSAAALLHEATTGKPLELCSDNKNTTNRGCALCGRTFTHSAPEQAMLYAFQGMFPFSAHWTLIRRRRTMCG